MLTISIVLYHPDVAQVDTLCQELMRAECLHRIFLIDNSPTRTEWPISSAKIVYYWNEGEDVGYGAAHNIAILESLYYKVPFHLMLHPDIEVKAEDVDALYYFMTRNPLVGILSPQIQDSEGKIENVASLLPTPWQVFFRLQRKFLPSGGQDTLNAPTVISPFLMARTKALGQVRLFDEQYFREETSVTDLIRCIHRDFLTLYIPEFTVVHHRKHSAPSFCSSWKNWKDWYRYFHKWGWGFDKERRMVNRLTLESSDNP